ncbi:MAG: hypothetical protein K8R69_12510 [Deltaproteobacteria bacterium]|nr:hypothetical protein [Deltaproteobacteria bacterium]
MVGVGAAAVCVAAVVAVGAAVAAGVAASASSSAAESNAEAQKYVADANAKATVQAAALAADAQKASAQYDSQARMHESDVAFNTDLEYIKQDKWASEREDSKQNFYQQTQAQVDSIDMYYSGEGSWGVGSEPSYDYGYDGGGGSEITTS